MSRDSITHRAASTHLKPPTRRQSINTSTLASLNTTTSDYQNHYNGRLHPRFTPASDDSSQILNVSIPKLVSQIRQLVRLEDLADKCAARPAQYILWKHQLKTSPFRDANSP